jgi:hypothetical protein
VRGSQLWGWDGLLSRLRAAAIVSAALVALLAGAGLASSAQAATYTVGTTSDTPRGVPCERGPASGTCSLRQLLEYENALETPPSPPDVIVVPSGTYELLYGTLTITQSLVILGGGARTTTVDISSDAYPERVFITQSPAESASGIFGLKIAGGTADADENSYSDFGGDIRNTGSLLLSEDWITEGTASGGAGIANDAGTLVLERSLVSDNHASTGSGEAGGIQNYGSAGCEGECTGKKAVLAVEDSTVADNDASLGAGIFSLTEDEVPDENGVSIINSTIAYNSTQEEPCDGCTARGLGAGLLAYDGTIAVEGSIVAYNSKTSSGKLTYTNCAATSPATIVSPLGYDLETGTDCGFKSTGDLQNTSPDFSSSAPQNNGGSTNTLAPEPTSPAVDAIPTSDSTLCTGLDQRGVTRPQGAGCDIGAVELAPSTFEATGVPVSATAGTQFNGTVATFTEAVPDTVASDYTATINWGDGTSNAAGTISTASGGGFAVSGSHTYVNGGAYTISVKIADAQGATATATSTAAVTATTPPPSPAPPTLVATSPPTVITTTSAAFTTTVNPEGLATTVHFEYGPVLGGASPGTTTYGSVTPDQSVGPDFANHTVTATVTGLLPNVTYNVRVVATNSAGSATGPNQTLVTPADPPPPPPVLGKAVNVMPVSGIVYIELPPGAALASAASFSPFAPFALGVQAVEALAKGQAFVPLTEARQIPVGSILETTHGVVGITTATTASKKGKLQSGDFGAGIFKLLQGRRQKGLTELDMIDNHSASQVCATVGKGKARAAKHLSSKVLGRVDASAHGRFTVRGQYSAATVRGTVWNVGNRCEGTLTHVTRGVVLVRDFRRRKTITLFTGQSYLARAPVRRG